jgi:hypothetical protein
LVVAVLAVSLADQPQSAVLVLSLVQYQPLAAAQVLFPLITARQAVLAAVEEYLVAVQQILAVKVFLVKVTLAEITLCNQALALRVAVVVQELLD